MVIWIINQHSMTPKYGHFNRHFYIAKHLKNLGHKPIIFSGSYLHNTDVQMISDKKKYIVYDNIDYPYVIIKTCNYKGSKIKRIWSMLQFYFRMFRVAKKFKRPDVIIGSSPHLLASVAAIKLSYKY